MAITVPLITEFNPRGIKEAEKSFDRFARTASKAFGGLLDITKKVAIGAAGIATAAGFGAAKAIGSASDLSEEIAKTGELFGDVTDDILDFSKTAASSLGQSQQQALEAANTFAIFGRAAGYAGEDLFLFSRDFTSLASDLASFNNTSPQEAIEAIGAALRGESEPLRKYGVLLDDATLRQVAFERGIYDGNGALTQQQRIRAAEIAIWQQTKSAQDDFARTSDGLANTQRILQAELANVVAQIGTALLPIALKLARFVSEKLMPVVTALADAFSENGLSGVFQLAADSIRKYGPVIRDRIIEFLEAAANWIWNTGIPRLLELMQQAGQTLVDWIKPRIRPMLSRLGEFIAAAANWVLDTGLPMLVDKLVQLGDALVAWIKPRIAPALAALGDLLIEILNWIVTTAAPKLSEQLLKLANAMVGWIIEVAPEVIKELGRLLIRIGIWFLQDGIPAIIDYAKGLGAGIVDGTGRGLRALFGKLVEYGRQIVDQIISGVQQNAGSIGSAILGSIPGVGGVFNAARGIANILPFAEGGIVTRPTLGLVGEAGPEAVIPLNKAGMIGGGITINVAGSVIEERDLVERVRVGLIQAGRNGRQVA